VTGVFSHILHIFEAFVTQQRDLLSRVLSLFLTRLSNRRLLIHILGIKFLQYIKSLNFNFIYNFFLAISFKLNSPGFVCLDMF